jgi:hypothetical protein
MKKPAAAAGGIELVPSRSVAITLRSADFGELSRVELTAEAA